MDKQDLRSIGYSLTMTAMILLMAGLFTKFYSKVSSTPDEPFYYSTIYPYSSFSEALIISGVLALLIGVFLHWRVKK